MTEEPPKRFPVVGAAVFYLLMALGAFGVSWYFWDRMPVRLPDAELAPLSLRLGIGAGIGLGFVGLGRLFERYFEWARSLSDSFRRLLGELSLLEVGVLALASAVGEELLFRGVLLPWIGLFWSSMIFGLLHIGTDRSYLPWTVMAIAIGFVFGGVTLYTGDILAAVVAHLTINYFNLQLISRSA